MKTLAEIMARGCFNCKQPLTPETAYIATVSYSLVDSDVWTTPSPVALCPECAKRESEKS